MPQMATVAPDGEQDVQLLKDEEGGLMRETGITTVSFYKGDFNTYTQTSCIVKNIMYVVMVCRSVGRMSVPILYLLYIFKAE